MGRDKGLCLLNGKSLVGYAIDVLKEVCHPVLISANTIDYKSFGYPVIRDKVSGIGPLGGIYSSLLKSSNELNFILSCDMPLISTDLVRYIR
jgi:molybdopterin-guanine dinucleotide biosynthesis protein A